MKLTGTIAMLENIIVCAPDDPLFEGYILDAEEQKEPLQITLRSDIVTRKESFLDDANLTIKERCLRILVSKGSLVWINDKGMPRHKKFLLQDEYPVCTSSMHLFIGWETQFRRGEGIMTGTESYAGSVYEYEVPESHAGKRVEKETLEPGWYTTLIDVALPYATDDYLTGYLRRNFPIESILVPVRPDDGYLL